MSPISDIPKEPDERLAYMILHCKICVKTEQLPATTIGIYDEGMEIWCERCDSLVARFDPQYLHELVVDPPACSDCGEEP